MDASTDPLYRMKAEVARSIAHPIRLAVLDVLKDGEQCVCDIAEHVGAKRSNVSRHLGVLLAAGVVDYRKEGLRMIYRLKTPCLGSFLSCLTDVVREQIEQDRQLLGRIGSRGG